MPYYTLFFEEHLRSNLPFNEENDTINRNPNRVLIQTKGRGCCDRCDRLWRWKSAERNKALHYIGCDAVITKDKQVLQNADGAILPGVGSFADAMDCMKASGLTESVIGYANSGKPFLGICLGLQLLFEASEESPGAKGLGLLKGKITKIPAGEGLKIPHMGWNDLTIPSRTGLFAGITGNPYVYFVHSYYLTADDPAIVSSRTSYGVSIDASVQKGNIFATQFHPEKSGSAGLDMLRNFAAITRGEER